jgi:hypothetical protein
MNDLGWSRLSSIAELISSVAIVITLIYLSIQTHQNTQATLAASRDAVIESDMRIVDQMVADPTIEQSFTKPGRLTDLESMKLEAYLIGFARTREHQWIQYSNDLLDEQTWRSFMSGLVIILSYPRTRPWWDYARAAGYFDEGFMDHVDALLDEAPMWPAQYTYPFSFDQ